MNIETLNNLEIETLSAENGFFFVEFKNGLSLQCCLDEVKQSEEDLYENGPVYLDQIQCDNSGFDEGLCWDCNEWAAGDNDEISHINDFLIEKAREIGISIVS